MELLDSLTRKCALLRAGNFCRQLVLSLCLPCLLLQCCIEEDSEGMAQLLVEFNADLESRDIEAWTPLHAASNCGNLKMINFLLDHGASLVAINHDDKMPVDVAADSDIRYVLQQKMIEAGMH